MSRFALRVVIIAAAAGVIAVTILVTHRWTPDRLVIDWESVARAEGARVYIDGQSVGTLAKTRGKPRTTFRFEQGEHEVHVVVPGCDCSATTVVTHYPRERVALALVADEGDGARERPLLTLRQ